MCSAPVKTSDSDPHPNNQRTHQACDTWRRKAVERIAHLHPMLVVVSSSEAGKPAKELKDPLRDWATGCERVYRRPAGAADHVAALLDNLWPKSDAVERASGCPPHLNDCEQDQRDAVKDPIRQAADQEGVRRAGAGVIDPKPWQCRRSGRCPVAVGDT
ncbi:hypothetical protein ACIPSA_27560 [Streptomyces sp. NPDC086549]|uniref:hypothetical protein n=1 Tax=Streptomyces sp. NPDC086549 TaxID=3365752 RepID=UPI0038045730